jgi:two-component system sensor histidine kinase YesM
VSRLLAEEAARGSGLSYFLVGASGSPVYATRTMPPDFDPGAYGNWGVFRKARNAEGSAFGVRRRVADNGETVVIVAARAIRDPGGEILGFVLAELERPALVRAAKAEGGSLAADYELLSDSGLVAFSLSDPAREGRFADEFAQRSTMGAPGGLADPAPTAGSGAGTAAADARGRKATDEGQRTVGGFVARAYLPENLVGELTAAMRKASIMGLAACALLALGLAYAASRSVTGPILELSSAMRRLREGDLSIRLVPASEDELGELANSFNDTASEIDALMRETVEGQELLRAAELRSLAAQMNPHFLYNSLNSIRSLAKLDRNEEIVEIVAKLGKLLRASARNRAELSTVGAGLELVRCYLDVEKIRFGGRFSFSIEVPDGILDCELPSLVLEPLAENALTHGLECKGGPGRLGITGAVEEGSAKEGGGRAPGTIVIAFEDDGPGVESAMLDRLRDRLAKAELLDDGSALGLAGTNRRLRLRYGDGYGLTLPDPIGGKGFRVELRVPQKRMTSDGEAPA